MKRFLLVILLVGGAMVGGSYYLTGRLPWVALSAEEQQVAALRDEFEPHLPRTPKSAHVGAFWRG